MGSQFLALSLFTILLSFFIILTSSVEYKQDIASSVISSIDVAFSKSLVVPLPKDRTVSSDPEIRIPTMGEGDTLELVEDLFQTYVINFTTQKSSVGDRMVIRVRTVDLEAMIEDDFVKRAAEETTGQEYGRQGFFETLRSVVKAKDGQPPYVMDLSITVSPEEWEADYGRRAEKDAISLYNLIRKADFPAHLMSVGLKEGEPGYTELVFRPEYGEG